MINFHYNRSGLSLNGHGNNMIKSLSHGPFSSRDLRRPSDGREKAKNSKEKHWN
jgi:hypothetical protein